jgi:hypothetical protein
MVKKSLCTWWLQYRKLQVMFKLFLTRLQIFTDTPNCVHEDRVHYSTVHIPNVFCDGHLQIINCVGVVRKHWVFQRTAEKNSGGETSGHLGGQMVVEMILSANTSSKNVFNVLLTCRSTPTLVAASRHNTHEIYQLSFMQRLLKMSK